MQNAYATYQFTQLIGILSLPRRLLVHVGTPGPMQLVDDRALLRTVASDGRSESQLEDHPGSFELLGFFPLPTMGLEPGYSFTKCRKRPTVTSKASIAKVLM